MSSILKLSGGGTFCLTCGNLEFMHRIGCRCNSLNVQHGYFKKKDGEILNTDDFVSRKTIVNHVKNGTATIYIDELLITKDMVE